MNNQDFLRKINIFKTLLLLSILD